MGNLRFVAERSITLRTPVFSGAKNEPQAETEGNSGQWPGAYAPDLCRKLPGKKWFQAVSTFEASSSPRILIDSSRILNFWIFPEIVMGKSSTNITYRGIL